ncbi:hypothetical protein E8E13_009814 [Curvularia kusanoi]|uniref:Glycoside hydrolase family 17 protein n=1 Tax=Curvularia kusanoi TaxID=90978 RepID=A0A9P4THG0_CURKU|nr:hypothetical protein E8E13_009814 [Curvularia kusanoi]
MKSIVIASALAAIIGTASSRPLHLKRDYVTEVIYVTETVAAAVVYVDEDGAPYSTSTLEQSSVAPSVEAVTTPQPVPTVTPTIPSAVLISSTAPAAASSPSLPPSSLVAPPPEPSSVEAENEPSTTPVETSSFSPPPSSPPVATTQTTPASSSSPAPPPPPPPPPPSATVQAPESALPLPAATSSSTAGPTASQAPQTNPADARSLPFGVTYDPFTGSQGNSRCKTDAEVADEFSRMSSYKVVRIYGMGCNIVPLAVQNALKNGQTIMGGAYLSNGGDGEGLSTVISTWKDAIDDYAKGSWDILKIFTVENERLDNHDMTASEIVDAIRRGRDQLRGLGYNGPVGAVDTVQATIDNPAICQASDVVTVNCHPFFDQNTAAADAGTFVKGQIERVKTACNTDRVVVTETGWPHQGDPNGKAVPSPDNQAKALASIHNEFTGDIFIHNSYDSPWKSDSASTFNAERYWGVIQ